MFFFSFFLLISSSVFNIPTVFPLFSFFLSFLLYHFSVFPSLAFLSLFEPLTPTLFSPLAPPSFIQFLMFSFSFSLVSPSFQGPLYFSVSAPSLKFHLSYLLFGFSFPSSCLKHYYCFLCCLFSLPYPLFLYFPNHVVPFPLTFCFPFWQ